MAKKQVKISCRGAGTLGLPLFKPFQGEGSDELKTLEKVDYERLKREIETDGFSFPVAIWSNSPDGENYILDGHQRVKTLRKMKDEGFSVPELPVVMVEAANFKEAKRKLLAAASQYGTVKEDGLLSFMKDLDITPEELVSSFRLPELDIQQFVADHLVSREPDPDDFGGSVIGENSPPPSQAADRSTAPTAPEFKPIVVPPQDNESQVRMVQLFLNGKTQPEFLQKIQRLQSEYETTNLTDTVLEVVREAFDALGK